MEPSPITVCSFKIAKHFKLVNNESVCCQHANCEHVRSINSMKLNEAILKYILENRMRRLFESHVAHSKYCCIEKQFATEAGQVSLCKRIKRIKRHNLK